MSDAGRPGLETLGNAKYASAGRWHEIPGRRLRPSIITPAAQRSAAHLPRAQVQARWNRLLALAYKFLPGAEAGRRHLDAAEVAVVDGPLHQTRRLGFLNEFGDVSESFDLALRERHS